ncbi:hypothetical protein HNR02_004237 [Amycolatopsis endophytica]|uniref:Uncharacterized protein n=1 Tax=Amycolatopsis endophytica TaxID=860233 RepID=A0A853B832_9PSEU|nr:hypothetical protein [Amycolatopsis endophytica]
MADPYGGDKVVADTHPRDKNGNTGVYERANNARAG